MFLYPVCQVKNADMDIFSRRTSLIAGLFVREGAEREYVFLAPPP